MTGPNSVECKPISATQASSSAGLGVKNPTAATSMMAISRSLTQRISRLFSSLSANWPLVAENSTNGRMNSAPITSPASAGGSQATCNW